jgi:hypothetical protein
MSKGIIMKFKAEIFLLLTAIALFAASAFLYSSPIASGQTTAAATLDFPYQGYAFSFVGFGSLIMVAASLSFLKRSKPASLHVPTTKRLAKNCAD